MKRKTKTAASPIEEFIALPDDEKERIWESYNREIPLSETTPLSVKERKEWETFLREARQKRRRKKPEPRNGVTKQPSRKVQITLAEALLKRADTYAVRHGLSRAQLVAKGLKLALAS